MTADRCDKGPRIPRFLSPTKWPLVAEEACPVICQATHHILTSAAPRKVETAVLPADVLKGVWSLVPQLVPMIDWTSASLPARPRQ